MSKSGREYFRLDAESYSSLGRVGKKEKKIACPLLDVFACGQVSSPRLYRLITQIFLSVHEFLQAFQLNDAEIDLNYEKVFHPQTIERREFRTMLPKPPRSDKSFTHALKNKKYIIATLHNPVFKIGHAIVIYGYDDGFFKIKEKAIINCSNKFG